MAIKTVSLRIRIKTSEGKRVVVNPVYGKKGYLKPLYALVGGVEEHHPEGVYVLRVGDKWEFVGQNPDAALKAQRRRQEELENSPAAPAPVSVVINTSGPTIEDAMEIYLSKKSAPDLKHGKEALAPKSISGMRSVIEAFRRTVGKTYLREVVAEDFLTYFEMLHVQANLDRNHPQYSEHLRKRNVTVKNHYGTLRSFFKRSGIDIALMLGEDVPTAKGRIPTAFSSDELLRMFGIATEEEKIRIQMACFTGFRRGEVAHMTWDDLDLVAGIAKVTAKYGWKPKNKREREVAMPDVLVEALRKRLGRLPRYDGAAWVFPSATGLPPRKNQLLYVIQSVAKRAGVTGRVDYHKLRSTYASLLNESGEVSMSEISGRLGHADTKTTQSYLERMNQNTPKAVEQSNKVFGKLA